MSDDLDHLIIEYNASERDGDGRGRTESIPADCPDPVAAKMLCARMSEISEDHYCAGWLIGLEYSLFAYAYEGGNRDFGMYEMSNKEIGDLITLSTRCDGWWYWRDDDDHMKSGETFVRMSEWTEMYKAHYASER